VKQIFRIFRENKQTNKKTSSLNKSEIRALLVAKKVSEYPVPYGKESTIVSLMLVVEIVREKYSYFLQIFVDW